MFSVMVEGGETCSLGLETPQEEIAVVLFSPFCFMCLHPVLEVTHMRVIWLLLFKVWALEQEISLIQSLLEDLRPDLRPESESSF